MRHQARLSTAVPHSTAFLPPAFMAILPPTQDASADVGSTANTKPARSAASVTRRVTTPAAEKITRPAQAKILVGDEKTILGLAQQREPFARRLTDFVVMQKETIPFRSPSADAATELVKLREAEAFGMLDDHDIRFRHVHADLDHRGGDENSRGPGGEVGDRFIAHRGVLLAMRQRYLRAEAGLQFAEAHLGCGDVHHFGFRHQRAYPIDAPAGGDGAGDAGLHVFQLAELVHGGDDRLPPGGFFADAT